MKYAIFLFVTAFVLLSLGNVGCHSSNDYPLLEDVTMLAEEAPESIEAQNERRKQLEALANVPYPDYYIVSGDVFTFNAYDNPELDVIDVAVTPDGYLALMLVGPLEIGGLTLTQATEKIQKAYAEYIKYPQIALYPRHLQGSKATISGKVAVPGQYPIDQNTRLADLIAIARGTQSNLFDGQNVELADLQSSIFVRNGEIIPVDFTQTIKGDPLNNPTLRNGDYVFISNSQDKLVSVVGEVNLPQFMIWTPRLGLSEVFTKARGLKEGHWSNALVIRGGMHDPKIYRVNIADVLDGKAKNPLLQPGDIVYVPKSAMEEYNTFIRSLLPTAQLINLITSPAYFWIR